MIFMTGDCHGDYRRFGSSIFKAQKEMTKADYVMICGDFGLWKDDAEQWYWLKWLEAKPFTTLWVDGNHENYDWLKTFPIENWHSGKVQKILPSIIHLCRGQVFDLDGMTFFTFGGAASHDISGGVLDPADPLFKSQLKQARMSYLPYRILHHSWWPEEMPSADEYAEGWENLARYNDKVDVIVTHCASTSTQSLLSAGRYQPDALTDYLEEVRQKVTFQYWFFGHYHDHRRLNMKEHLLYEQIIRII